MHQINQVKLCPSINSMWLVSRNGSYSSANHMQSLIQTSVFPYHWGGAKWSMWWGFSTSSKMPKETFNKRRLQRICWCATSVCTIADYKHLQVSEIECDAGVALAKKESSIKVTLHYETSSKNSIDGEWPSLILNFSDKQEFHLLPLFFAYEDRSR